MAKQQLSILARAGERLGHCSFVPPNLRRLLRCEFEVVDQEQQPRHMVRHPRASVLVSIFCSHRDAEPMRGLDMVESQMVLDHDGILLGGHRAPPGARYRTLFPMRQDSLCILGKNFLSLWREGLSTRMLRDGW